MENKEEFEYVVVAWARINDRGDLYDLNLQCNPFVDEKIMVPLYMKKEKSTNETPKC
jgi:hypothetical protein